MHDIDRKDLFTVFLKHSNSIDLNRINTNLIFNTRELHLFLKGIDDLYRKEIYCTTVADICTDYIIFVSKEGIIFFLYFYTRETSPEGPNNEPPGIESSCIIKYCTKSSKLFGLDENIRDQSIDIYKWELIKSHIEKKLENFKKISFL